jgi:hypothetical protein
VNPDHVFGHIPAASASDAELDPSNATHNTPPVPFDPFSDHPNEMKGKHLSHVDIDSATRPRPCLIIPSKSLKDIVLGSRDNSDRDVLLYEQFQEAKSSDDVSPASDAAGSSHGTMSVSERTTVRRLTRATARDASRASGSPTPSEPKSPKKKKKADKAPRCKKCKTRGHRAPDCPSTPTKSKEKKEEEDLECASPPPPVTQQQARGIKAQKPVSPFPDIMLDSSPDTTASVSPPTTRILEQPALTTLNGDADRLLARSLLFVPSKLTEESALKVSQSGTFAPIIPQHSTYDGSEQTMFSHSDRSTLTTDNMGEGFQGTGTRDTEATTDEPLQAVSPAVQDLGDLSSNQQQSESKEQTSSEPRRKWLDFFRRSTKLLGYGILGPHTLTVDTAPPVDKDDVDVHWDSDETAISPSPEICGLTDNRMPWPGTQENNNRNEVVELHPSIIAVEPPTPQPIKEQRTAAPCTSIQQTVTVAGSLGSPEETLVGKDSKATSMSIMTAPAPGGVQELRGILTVDINRTQSQKHPKGLKPSSSAPGQQQQQGHKRQKLFKQKKSKEVARKTQSNLGTPLPFKTVIASHIEAWTYASMVYSSPTGHLAGEFGPHHLVMWTDATAPGESDSRRFQALSVTYQHPHAPISQSTSPNCEPSPWHDWAFTADVDRGFTKNVIDVLETMAAEVAVGIALGEVDKSRESDCTPIRKVTVFTDSQHALTSLGNRKPGYRRTIEEYAEKLAAKGVAVELRWVPSHGGVVGNERADRLALLASLYAPRPEGKGGMVRVPVPLLRVCESQVKRMEAWARGANQDVLKPYLDIQRRELKEALRVIGAEEGWLAGV